MMVMLLNLVIIICDNPDGDDGDEDEIAPSIYFPFSIASGIKGHDRGDLEHVHRKYDICVS